MRKYYTRPCNFYYGNYAKGLVKNKKALSLTGNLNIGFDHIEIFQRKKRKIIKSYSYSIFEIMTADLFCMHNLIPPLIHAAKLS